MAHIDPVARTVRLSIVYLGPFLSGKSSNLDYIELRTTGEASFSGVHRTDDEVVEASQVNFRELMPIELGDVGEYHVTLELHGASGHPAARDVRSILLEEASVVVFVVDSRRDRLERNVAAMEELRAMLREQGRSFADVPLVVQYNKRDREDALPVAELRGALGLEAAGEHTAIARTGTGVMETMKAAGRLALHSLLKKDEDGDED